MWSSMNIFGSCASQNGHLIQSGLEGVSVSKRIGPPSDSAAAMAASLRAKPSARASHVWQRPFFERPPVDAWKQ